MTLAEIVSRRLLAAGFHYDDPALVTIRRHNAAVYAMAARKLRTGFSDPLADPAPGRPRWAVLSRRSNIAKPGT